MSLDVKFAQYYHLGVITLSRPLALNALNLGMIKDLQNQLQEWQADKDIHAIVLQAAPGKAFCAGGDVRWLYETGLRGLHEPMQFFWHEYRLNHFIHQYPKPYIALMDGVTMGGGVGIALHGSYPVASEKFIFAMPETGIGLFPDIGASFLLSQMPGALGLYLALTGNKIGADDARAFGLIKEIIPSNELPNIVPKLQAMDLSKNAGEKISAYLHSMKTLSKNEAPLNQELLQINDFFSKGSVQEIIFQLEASDSPWAIATLKNLQQKSPLSLEVTFAQMKKVKSMSLAECLKMDYCLVRHFMEGKDFYEGVRALLIDKDKTPRWQPSSLNQVTEALVANYFECSGKELILT